jgi:hypothetical protein
VPLLLVSHVLVFMLLLRAGSAEETTVTQREERR